MISEADINRIVAKTLEELSKVVDDLVIENSHSFCGSFIFDAKDTAQNFKQDLINRSEELNKKNNGY